MSEVAPVVVEGCRDPWEELALAFCRGTQQAARDLVRRKTLVTKRDAVRAQSSRADAELAKAKKTLAVVARESEGIAWGVHPQLVYGICGLVGISCFLLLFMVKTSGLGTLALIGAGTIAAAVAAWISTQKRRAYEKVTSSEQEVGRLFETDAALQKEDASLCLEIEAIQPSGAVRAVGRVYFPATIESVGGYNVALDRSGAAPMERFRLADFMYDSSELVEILAAIENLKYPPEMLQPAAEEGVDEFETLHGEEILLRDTVTRFARFVGSIPTTDVALPFVPSAEIARAGFRFDRGATLPFPGAVLQSGKGADFSATIERLGETLGSVRRQGTAPKEALKGSYATIAALLRQYRELRTTSMGKIHEQLLGAMERSAWCAVHFYCPKATRNPTWILRRLGIDVETAHEMWQEDLMKTLYADEEIGQRLAACPDLVDRLDKAWMALDELSQGIDSLRSSATISAGGVGVAASPSAVTYSGTIRGLAAQREQVVRQYRDVLQEIIFGSRRPLIEMSTLPRLSLDPDTGIWRSETAGTEYRDFAEIECTQVLRMHEDLLFPVWRHLWSEKADFRKAELFRTNEQLLRMSEKESEKLISVGNQFRDDMRTTREILKQVDGELMGKVGQMRGTREALLALGLLSAGGAQTLGEASLEALGVGAGSALGHAEAKETLLALEPQAQTERRERAADPIDLVVSPAVLFQASPAEWFQARLSPGMALLDGGKTPDDRVLVSGATGGQ